MEIKVGEYVRTECGIAKIKEISIKNEVYELDKDIMYIHQENYLHTCTKSQILKHSFNIKELIENKDILKVKTKENIILMIGFDENTIDIKYKEIIEEIENGEYELLEILTHEQYERNCYKLEDNQCTK